MHMTTKRFLACSSGGDRGVILIGMLLELHALQGEEAVSWEDMAGISAGAFCVASVAQTDSNSFQPAMLALQQAFETGKIDVVEHPMFPFLHVLWAIWCKKSLFSNTKMLFQIDKWFDATKLKRPFQVGAYNKTDMCYESFSSAEMGDDMRLACLASASIPLVFPETKIRGKHYEDGGVCHIIPVVEIKAWLAKTAGPRQVDVMVCYPVHDKQMFTNSNAMITAFPMVNESTRMISDLMLQRLQDDLHELSKLCGIELVELTRSPYGKWSSTDANGSFTIQLVSPSMSRYGSIMSMTANRNKDMFAMGKAVVDAFIKA